MPTDMQYPDFTRDDLTIGQIYGYAVEVTEPAEAERFMADLLNWHIEKWHQSPEEARITILSNIGYYAGYYDQETAERCYRLYGAVHPIFGRTQPTAEQAFALGLTSLTKRAQDEDIDHAD